MTGLTDPFGAQIGYSYDRSDRLSGVTGANFANVSQYASDFQYRAWGALKHLDYGNTRELDVNYDVRLNISRWEVPGIMGADVQYHPDGNARFVQDRMETNSKFDRAFAFDHVGQLSQALTGSEARGVSVPDGPFNESLAHDVWSNMTSRSMRHWTQNNSFTASYLNNRNTAWQYDAAGNPTEQGGLTEYTYDAEGRQSRSYNPEFMVLCSTSQGSGPTVVSLTLINSFDGDGQKVKQSETRSVTPGSPGLTQHTYFVRSSVVRGAVINELSGTGTKSLGFVYAGSDKLARQVQNGTNQAVVWEHRNPAIGSEWRSDNAGVKSDRVELDPLGADVGVTNPYTGGGGGDCEWSQIQYPRFGSVFDLGTGCVLDWMEVPCEIKDRYLTHGIGLAVNPERSNRYGDQFPPERSRQDEIVYFSLPAQQYNLNTLLPHLDPLPQDVEQHGGGLVVPLNELGTPPPNRYACDLKLAKIFGGEGAVVGSSHDPRTLAKFALNLAYYSSAGIPIPSSFGDRGYGHGPEPVPPVNPKYPEDAGGIIHIYGNAQGTATNTGLYAPSGGSVGPMFTTQKSNSQINVNYPGGLRIAFVHVSYGNGGPNGMGSDRIGNIGGPGGNSAGYVHSHLVFFKDGVRVDPRTIYCKEFGF